MEGKKNFLQCIVMTDLVSIVIYDATGFNMFSLVMMQCAIFTNYIVLVTLRFLRQLIFWEKLRKL